MSAEFTFDAIQPLIVQSQVDARTLSATFRCPVTRQTVHAFWKAPPIGASAIVAQARGTALFQVRSQVNSLVRSFLGYGHAGRFARTLSDTALAGSHASTQLSTTEEERGLVAAFRSVSSQFAWDGKRWVHASRVGQTADPLLEAVESGPDLTPYDRAVAARMLVAVADAHGGISDDERMHLSDAFDGELGSIEGLLKRPPLTLAELRETTYGTPRRAMLGVAWSMALCDETFDIREAKVIEDFAEALGIGVEEQVEIKRMAQMYVLDQFMERMFAWGEHDATARDQLYALAESIDVTRGAVERAEARFQKRRVQNG